MALDRRITPFRDDLAADWLEGKVDAARFVSGVPMQIMQPVADIRKAPAPDAQLDSQALRGDIVTVYETTPEGWAWGQLRSDGYVGYFPSSAFGSGIAEPTHRVNVRSTLTYPAPAVKAQPVEHLPYGAGVVVLETSGEFCRLSDGRFAWSRHLCTVEERAADFVAVAETMLETPYLWGGTSAWGLDCSGLIHTGLRAAGYSSPRDSDLLEAGFGEDLGPYTGQPLQRGDFVFWKGHVGVMTDTETLLHANGYHMRVVSEPLSEAVERIAYLYARPTSCRRPPQSPV